MARWNLAWLLAIPAVCILALAISHSAPVRSKDKDYEFVRLLVDVLDEVDKNYIRELDADAKRKLVEDMINGGLDHLDPHSNFMNPKEFKLFSTQSKGKFGGIGIQISTDRQTGQLSVVSPIVGTPAYEAGVLAGDVITKINSKATDGMRLSEAVDMIQGEPGTEVTLTVRHEGAKDEHDLTMKRAIIEMQSVMGDLRKADDPKEWDYFVDKESKIAYIRLVAFSENTAADLRKALDQLKKEGIRGLVLDLRNNPGGLLNAAWEVANLFISEGRIVSTKGRNQKERVYDAKPGDAVLVPAQQYPMAVLINKYSASASEIVAAALQDHGRAVVIGERSYGKGSVQNILKLENDQSALKLTTASYWRPSGKNIHRFPDSKDTDEWGVSPTEGFEVKLKDEQRLEYLIYRRDRDIVHGKPGSPPAAPPKPKLDKDGKEKPPFVDEVLQKALDYLRGEIKKNAGGAQAPALRPVADS
jgi:carboxyl-terminal processing protease